MAIDKNLVSALLDNLRMVISRIDNMDITMEEISTDTDIQDLLDRRVQLAIEMCMDIATHIVAGLALPRQETAADTFLLLSGNHIISKELGEKLSRAVGLRNILVHEYTKIDYQLAYSDLEEKLKDLKEFGKEIVEFLDQQ